MKICRLLLLLCLPALTMAGCYKQDSTKSEEIKNNTVTVLVNGHIFSIDEAHPWADAMAFKNGKIVAVGTRANVLGAISSEQKVVSKDLKGHYVFPGLIDSHTHPGLVGLTGESGASANVAITDPNERLPEKSPDELLNWWLYWLTRCIWHTTKGSFIAI